MAAPPAEIRVGSSIVDARIVAPCRACNHSAYVGRKDGETIRLHGPFLVFRATDRSFLGDVGYVPCQEEGCDCGVPSPDVKPSPYPDVVA